MNKHLLTLVLLCLPFLSQAQIDGDNIFGTDQIVSIDLTFPESDFWSTLTDNYAEDENEYIWADLLLTDITGTYSFDSVGVRLKGNSSYSHPGNKKSFKIDFNKFVSGQDYDGLKKLNFSNGFKDPSVIREKVFFDVCRAASVPAPRAGFADVYFNGTHWGFYTIIEQIDDQFLDWNILDDDGNLFKAGDNFGGGPGGGGDAADLVYYGAAQSEYEDRYELKTNEEESDWSDLITLIDFIDTSSDTEFAAEVESRIELTEFLRSYALDALFSNLDSYTGSARNYYIYHDLSSDRWRWIKWDGNEAFGSYTNNAGNMTTLALDYRENDRPLLDRFFDDPDIYTQYLQEVCDLREELFNSAYMDQRINEIKALVQASVYADNNKMYSNADFDTNIESDITGGGGPGGGNTTYGLKSFVADRSQYLDGALDCSTFVSLTENEPLQIRVYPNPTATSCRLRWNEPTMSRLLLVDTQGRSLRQIDLHGKTDFELEVGAEAAGIYQLHFTDTSGRMSVQKLVVQ